MKKLFQSSIVLFDENVDVRIKSIFRHHRISIHFVPKGSTDEKVFVLAETLGAVLVTHDKDFTNTEFYNPSSHTGILVLSIHPPLKNSIESSIELLFQALAFSDLYGRITVLTPRGIEIIG